jgi:hypothetical protein
MQNSIGTTDFCQQELPPVCVQALRSVYHSEGLLFSELEQVCLDTAHHIFASAGASCSVDSDHLADIGEISGSVRLPCLTIHSKPAFLHFQLPASYPEVPPHLRIDCEGPRYASTLEF